MHPIATLLTRVAPDDQLLCICRAGVGLSEMPKLSHVCLDLSFTVVRKRAAGKPLLVKHQELGRYLVPFVSRGSRVSLEVAKGRPDYWQLSGL